MKYIVSLLLLLVNLYNYQFHLSPLIYLAIHIILILLFIYTERKKSYHCIMIELLIASWPYSWTNIFGSGTDTLQLPWFYIFGLILAIRLLAENKNGYKLKGTKLVILNYLFLLMYSVAPLIISINKVDAAGDYIMLIFYLILMFSCKLSIPVLDNYEVDEIEKLFIFENMICAIGIIFQYYMFKNFHKFFFKIGVRGSFKGMQISCRLLFEDSSCSTIMLGCGVLCSLFKGAKNKIWYIIAIVILIGLALTSRRTGVISLLVIVVPFLFKVQKNKGKKILLLIAIPILLIITFYFLMMSRPVENINQYTDNNGRIDDYISSIKLSLKNPIGIGYGDEYLSKNMTNGIIPHNTILRWINQGGLLLAFPLIILFYDIYKISRNKKLQVEYWILLYVFLASNFIPDILNSRFLIIIILIILLYDDKKIINNGKD